LRISSISLRTIKALRLLLLFALSSLQVNRILASTPELRGYRHIAFTSENGGISSAHSVGQDNEGYLWVGGPEGLHRFDGVVFQSIETLTSGMVRASDIANVAISPKGGLWIMSTSKGLLRYKDGQITQLGITNCTPQSRDPAIVETAEGTLWIRTYGGLYRFDGSKCEKVGQETGWTGDTAQSLFLDKDETLWVKSDSGDLLFLPKGSHHFQKNAFGHGKADSVSVLRQGLDGAIWLSDENGLHRVTPGSRGAKPSKDSLLPANTVGGALFFDRDGAMWILTKAGVRVIREPETLGSPQASASEDKLFTTAGGLTSDAVWDLLQDREGTIWVATDGGLDRLTANPILQLQLPKARDAQYALLPDLDNTVWTANWDAPLMLVSDRHIEIYNQIPNSIEGIHRDRTGAVWFSGGEQDALWRRTGKRMERVKAPVSGANPVSGLAGSAYGSCVSLRR
jgi:ligand-binding sensor domain-containing protein